MLSYRALLIDTERKQERPVQALFMELKVAVDWAQKALAKASDVAEVEIYQVMESRLGVYRNSDKKLIPNDEIAAQGI